MFYVSVGLILTLVYLGLILTTNVNIWPELFFFPWLVHKGLLPYRDFFDHHGFLLSYFLAPLSEEKSLILIKGFFYFISLVNLFLVLKILKKLMFKLSFFLGGFLYVMINFLIAENNLWYELVITTFFLITFNLLTSKKSKYQYPLIGIFIALASFIKPTAAIILLPLFILSKSSVLLLSFSLSWLLVILYLTANKTLYQFINYVFFFNRFLGEHLDLSSLSDIKFLLASLLIVFLSIFILLAQRRIERIFFPLSFLVTSFIFPLVSYGRTHLVPAVTFFSVLIGFVLKESKGFFNYCFLTIFAIYLGLLTINVGEHYFFLKDQRLPYIENQRSKAIISALKNLGLDKKKFYVFGNQVEIYYLLDQIPPTRFPFKAAFIEKFLANFEDTIVSEIKKDKVELIIIPKPIDKFYSDLKILQVFIKENCQPIKIESEFEICFLKD